MTERKVGFEIGLKTEKTPMELLLDVAHVPTFPFYVVKLTRSTTRETFVHELELKPTLYDCLLDIFKTDKLAFYINLPSGKIEAWTYDMLLTMNLLSEMQIMSPIEQWVARSRPYASGIASGSPVEVTAEPISPEEALPKVKDILEVTALLEAVDKKDNLFRIVKDVIGSRAKDPDSIIYRVAMTIYHSESISQQNVLPELDPGVAYLRMSQSQEFLRKYPQIDKKLGVLPIPLRTATMKTFMCFVIASYIYYKTLSLE